jgi:RND family efflux transporter MFP subunit
MTARLVWIVIVGALAAGVAVRVAGAKKQDAAPAPGGPEAPLVKTAKVSRVDLSERVALTGTIRPRNEVDVFAKAPGRVAEVRVRVGDRVRAGQELAEVEHKESSLQARMSQAQVQMAAAGVRMAEAGLDGARLELERTQALAAGGSAPQAALDGARIKLALAEAQLAQAKGQLGQAEAALALNQQLVANAKIESPIAGVVTRRNVDVGRSAGAQVPAFTVQDLASLKLETSVDGLTASRLERGRPVEIRVDAWPGEVFPGRIDLLAPALDPATRRASLEVLVDRAGGKLLANMFAHAQVSVRELPKALAVPKAAVLEAAGGALVYRVRQGKVEAVKPELGPGDGSLVAVTAGLDEGDEVVVTGLGNLADGLAVQVASSASLR